MSSFLNHLESLAIGISKPAALIGVLGLLMIAVITIATVVARSVFNAPLVWGHDVASLIIIVVVATCFPTGVMQRKHVAIEFLGAALGPRGERVLNTFAALITTIAMVVIAWQVTKLAGQEAAMRGSTIVARIPTAPVWWLAAGIVWLSVPMQLLVTFQAAVGRNAANQSAGGEV